MVIYREFSGVLEIENKVYTYRGCERDWNMMEGYEGQLPEGHVFEFTNEETGRVVWADNFDEALERLRSTLERRQ